jgi:hypothetical protein
MNPRISALLGEIDNIKHFFNAVRFVRQKELLRRKQDWSWEKTGFKIYPTSLKSFTMCPHRFVREDVHKPPGYNMDALCRMEVGKSLHTMYQTEILQLPNILWELPDFSCYTQEVADKQKMKLEEIWPEVPILCTKSGISGRADAVLNIFGEPVVFDIKTTSVADVQKELDKEGNWTGNWLENCWQEYIKQNLPSKQHEMQVFIYCHLMNKLGFYKKKIRKAALGYINLLMDSTNESAEHEVYFDFTEETEAKVELLVEHLALERYNYLEGIDSSCSYPACRAHSKGKK